MDRKKNLAIDVVALVIYLVVANPTITGIGLHEWIGLGVFIVFLVHCVVHFDWVVEAVRTIFKSPSFSRTGNLVLDALILVSFMICTVSGIFVSGAVLPTFGLYADGYYFWDPLHATSAKLLLALLLLHVVIHWKWLAGFVRKGKRGHALSKIKREEAD